MPGAEAVTAQGARYVAQRFGLLAVFGVVLFTAAGRWDWLRGWAYLGAVALLEGATLVLLAVRAPETLNQRGVLHSGIPGFERVFAGLWLLLALVTPAVAGLDAVRFHGSSVPGALFFVGLGALVLASALGAWAMLENPYFEPFVRIQEERGHRPVTTGPYRFVRHPGYAGAILGVVATPLVLGSLWALVPAALLTLLFAVRTQLEDRTLRRSLPGYAAYAERTRFRLVPFIW